MNTANTMAEERSCEVFWVDAEEYTQHHQMFYLFCNDLFLGTMKGPGVFKVTQFLNEL